jgi:hypothetical protein
LLHFDEEDWKDAAIESSSFLSGVTDLSLYKCKYNYSDAYNCKYDFGNGYNCDYNCGDVTIVITSLVIANGTRFAMVVPCQV